MRIQAPGAGWCRKHYERWKKYGDPLGNAPTRILPDPQTRVWPHINKRGPIAKNVPRLGRCWEWTASTDTHGYGQFHLRGRVAKVYRYLYETLIGPVPAGLELDHFACDNKLCCRPTHVRPVTHQENIARAKRKTHCPQGHEYTADNPSGQCRICNRDRLRVMRERRRAEQATDAAEIAS